MKFRATVVFVEEYEPDPRDYNSESPTHMMTIDKDIIRNAIVEKDYAMALDGMDLVKVEIWQVIE